MDLSIPFAKATENIANVAAGTAAEVGNATAKGFAQKIGGATKKIGNVVKTQTSRISKLVKGINFRSWRTWVIIAGALVVLYLLFRGMTAEVPKPVEEPPQVEEPQLPQLPPPIEIAKYHEEMFRNSVSPEKLRHFSAMMENYENVLRETHPRDPEFGEMALKLARYYNQGVAEHYDSNTDTTIPGIPPDTARAVMFYQQAIRSGFYTGMLELAAIFHWGNANFKPNREYAKHLYGAILKTGDDYEKGIARDRLRQMQEEEGKMFGSILGGLDGAGNGFGATPFSEDFCGVGDQSGGAIGKDDLTKDIDEGYVDELIENDLHLGRRVDDSTGHIRKRGESPRGPSFTGKVADDSHNARDHVVMATVRQSIDRLRQTTNVQDDQHTTLKKLHQFIVRECDLPESKRHRALRVLKAMTAGVTEGAQDNFKELEALSLVFNRINSRFREKKERITLLENLVNELSECIEYGELVCQEGRVNRIVGALDHIDDAVRIKPKWALNREMMYKAAGMRKKAISKSKAEVKEALNSPQPTARQRLLAKEFRDKLKRDIEQDFIRQYVDTGVLTKDLLKTEISRWIDTL